MSKRQLNCAGAGAGGKRSRPKKKHPQDDCHKGLSICKIDPDTLQDTAADLQEPMAGFPEPPILRLAAQKVNCEMKFAALGSSIFIATHPSCGQTPTLVYDTETAALTIGPRLPAPLLSGFNFSVAAGDTLYGMSSFYSNVRQQHSFEGRDRGQAAFMFLLVSPRAQYGRLVLEPFGEGDWITSPTPCTRMGAPSSCLPMITTTAALQGAPTQFDTEHCKWWWHGDWVLPFDGQGYCLSMTSWTLGSGFARMAMSAPAKCPPAAA